MMTTEENLSVVAMTVCTYAIIIKHASVLSTSSMWVIFNMLHGRES